MSENILDIAHISLLELIKTLIAQSGAASAKGALMRVAIKAGEKVPGREFASFDEFAASSETTKNPISRIEGKSVHLGDGVFGLPVCPFAASIGNFKEVFGALPESYAELTQEYNTPTAVTAQYRIGHGSGVSPFCAVHQPMRSAAAAQVTVGGKKLMVYQLGCKAAGGKKALAEKWLAEAGVDRAKVEKILETNMCCYLAKVEP